MAILKRHSDNNETFSVVVPVYNRESLVAETLDSIFTQDYRPIHLIIVDNNSTDNSRKVAEEWGNKHESAEFRVTVVDEPRPGAASARNRGLNEVTGDIMAFFDSDDIMLPEFASTVMRHFRNDSELEILCWPMIIRLLDGKERVTRKMGKRKMESHLIHSCLSTLSYAFRRKIIEKAGGWDQNIYAWDDFELGVRLLKSNPKCATIDKPLCVARRQTESLTGETFHAKEGIWENALNKVEHTLQGLHDKESRESYIRMVDYRRAILAAHYTREGYPETGKKLLAKSLENPTFDKKGRIALRLSYFITSHHIRGAWTFFGSFIR